MTPSHPAALSMTDVTACRKEADGAGISFPLPPPRGPTIRADFLSAQVAPWSQVTTRVSHDGDVMVAHLTMRKQQQQTGRQLQRTFFTLLRQMLKISLLFRMVQSDFCRK